MITRSQDQQLAGPTHPSPDQPTDRPTARVMAPSFFTSLGVVSFNFTGFADANSGPLTFRWGLGSAPGRVDVLPAVPYNGGCG
jgi:hypothetical protein